MTTRFHISPTGLAQFMELRHQAADAVAARFQACHAEDYARFGEAGRKACRDDIEHHLDFLRPVLELGSVEPYVDYLHWLIEVLDARHVPTGHIGQSLAWLGEFLMVHIAGRDGTMIVEALATAWSKVQRGLAAPPPSATREAGLWPEQAALEHALLAGDRQGAVAIVATLTKAGRPLAEIYVHLIQVALYRIGHRWLRNEVSVAQEHLATATALTIMADAFSAAPLSAPHGRRALFACIEGNRHYVGLRMVADAHEIDGWQVQFLGADTPTRALVDQVQCSRPDLVGLSVAFPHQLGPTREAVRTIRTRLGIQSPKIILGGAAINRYQRLAHHLEADGYATDAIQSLAPVRPKPDCRP